MANRPSLDDYVDVAERLQDFMDAHPNGSLQTISWEVCEIGNAKFVVYRAAAYRHPEDPRPGHGIAWEPFPGGTPYTKNSELMNAETAAWGRAIVALGLAANRKLASRQEVRARVEEQEAAATTAVASTSKPKAKAKPKPKDEPKPAEPLKDGTSITAEQVAEVRELVTSAGWDADQLRWGLLALDVADPQDLKAAMAGLSVPQFEQLKASLASAIEGSG